MSPHRRNWTLLWSERRLLSMANLTRADAVAFLDVAREAQIKTTTKTYPLAQANDAQDDLRHGRFQGAAVFVPD